MRKEELQAKLDLARIAYGDSNYKEVERQANEVIEMITSNDYAEEDTTIIEGHRAKAFLFLAGIYRIKGENETALQYAQVAIEIIDSYHLNGMKAMAFTIVGHIEKDLGNFDSEIINYTKAFEMNEEYGDKTRTADFIFSLGNAYSDLGNLDKALELYSESLTLNKKFNNESSIAKVLGNIGLVYGKLEKQDMAIDYLNQALSLQQKLGDRSEVALLTGNLGVEYFSLSSYESALECFTQALEIHEELGEKIMIANVTANIGKNYDALGKFDEAIVCFNRATDLYLEMNDRLGFSRCLCGIGNVYANKKFTNYSVVEAENCILKAIEISKELNEKFDVFISYKALADLYQREKRWEEGLTYHRLYHDLEKEVRSMEATKQSQQLENRRKIEEAERDRQVKLARLQEQEKILLNILPAQIAERILDGEKRIADLHEQVSVFFSDIVDFTNLSQTISPDELVTMLNDIFSEFDRIARKHGLEKIKTIGDSYMAVAGVPIHQEDHAERAAGFALDVIDYMKEYRKNSNSDLQIRVGLHCGKAIAGVIGENKFAYDLWGDAVNTASRMESYGEAGKIHVSGEFKKAVSESSITFIERAEIDIKGKGTMKTYFLEKSTL